MQRIIDVLGDQIIWCFIIYSWGFYGIGLSSLKAVIGTGMMSK